MKRYVWMCVLLLLIVPACTREQIEDVNAIAQGVTDAAPIVGTWNPAIGLLMLIGGGAAMAICGAMLKGKVDQTKKKKKGGK